MRNGFVVLDRAIFDHHLLQDADRFRAWCWLIAHACWKPTKHNISGKTVTLERGQLCYSVRQIADKLGWSKSAVDRFLIRLETETMIERKAGHAKSIITICNYAKYQDISGEQRDSSGTLSGTAAGQQRDTKEPINQLTNKPEPKGSKARKRANRPDDVSESVWGDFVGQRKKLFTETALKGFRREADKAGWSLEDAMAHAAMRGWEGFNADWVKEHSNGKSGADKRDGVAKALDRRIGLFADTGEVERHRAGGDGGIRALPAPAAGDVWP